MVNLTTASLEPAPLSSGWKSGSLPTGFTPTILGARKGGRDAARCETEREEDLETKGDAQKAEAWTEAAAIAERLPRRPVPSHARSRSARGRERERGRRQREGRRAAPSSHRAAGPPALAQFDVISASSVLTPTAQSKYTLRGPTPLRSLSLAGAAQAQTSSGHKLRCGVRLKHSSVLPRLVSS